MFNRKSVPIYGPSGQILSIVVNIPAAVFGGQNESVVHRPVPRILQASEERLEELRETCRAFGLL